MEDNKVFEDEFMDIQARIISLCLELLSNAGKEADIVYVYLFQNDDEDYIDAFFEKEGKLYTTNDLFSEKEIDAFFDCGVEDIESMIELCKAHNVKCAHEFKLIYNINTKSFDSNYNYENMTEVRDKDVLELVEEWYEECSKNIK